MKILVSCGVYTVLMFAAFVYLDDGPVWASAVGAVLGGALFALLTWLYDRYVPAGRSSTRFDPPR